MADPSDLIEITNNASTAVVTLDAYDPDGGGDGSGYTSKQVYEQPLTLLETTTGTKTIAGGGSAEIKLDGTYDEGGTTKPRTIYELISARPTDLFPVRNSVAMQGIIDPVYKPITISDDDEANMKLAVAFNVNIMAFPTSDLAKGFVAALNKAQSGSKAPGNIDDVMAAYFKGTKQYKTLTLNMVVTASTYMSSFAFTWAGTPDDFATFSSSITYYLYSSGSPGQNSNTAPPKYEGKLVMSKVANPPAPASTTDRLGAYEATYTDPDNSDTTLYYDGGQFVSSTTEDVPAVAIRGSFVQKSALTNKGSDTQLVPILVGRANGQNVMGTTVQQSTDGKGSGDFWAFFHPKTFQGWFNIIMGFFGVLFAIKFVADGVQAFRKWWTSRGQDAQPSDVDQMRQEIDELREEIRDNQQDLLDRLGGEDDNQVPDVDNDDIDESLDAEQADLVDQYLGVRADAALDALENQARALEEIAEVGVNPQIEDLAGQIRGHSEAIDGAESSQELSEALDKWKLEAPDISESLDNLQEEVANQLSEEQQEAIDNYKQAANDAAEFEEAADSRQQDADEGEGGDDDDPIDFDA